MKKRITIVIALVLVSLITSAAYGALVTKSFTANFGPKKTDWTTALSLQQFNSSWGNLVGVKFKIDGTLQGTIGMQNLDDAMAQSPTVHLEADLAIVRGSTTLATNALLYQNTYTLDPFDGSAAWWEAADGRVVSVTQSTTPGTFQNVTGSFTDYIGSGTFDVFVSAKGNSHTDGCANIASYYLANADATATVEYLYETPEPGSILALSSGLIGLLGFAVRRRK